jgi:hypothetical protein
MDSPKKKFVVLMMLLFSSLWAGTSLKAAFRPSAWKYLKPIEVPAGLPPGFCRFPLDGEVYAQSQSSLGDQRILDSRGREIPFALHEDRESSTEEEVQPHLYNQASLSGKYSTLSLDLGKVLPSNKLVLDTSSRNFKRRVEIEGSPDGRQWLVIKNNAYIFDFTGEQKVQLTELHYPESRYRYLRLKIWDQAETPLKIQGVRCFLTKIHTPQRVVRSALLVSRQEDAHLKTTTLLFDLHYENTPFDLITLGTAEENFSRGVKIEGSNNQKEWRTLLQSEFYRFRAARYEVEKLSLRVSEARCRYVKVLIYNFDDSPLQVNKVEFQGVEKELVFNAAVETSYWLYYGNPRVVAPRYDFEKTASYIKLDQIPALKLGAGKLNPGYVPPGPEGPWTEMHPFLFWSVLVSLVVGLGAYILYLMTKSKALT